MGRPAHLPIFWVYVSVPVGCAILLIHILAGLVSDAFALLTSRPRQDIDQDIIDQAVNPPA